MLTAGVVLASGQPADGVQLVIGGLSDHVTLDGAADRLDGGDGNDRLTGDNDVRLAGVRLQDGAGSRTVTINSVVADLDLGAGRDVLLGGNGDDVLIGDQQVVVAGVVDEGGLTGSVNVSIGSIVASLSAGADEDSLDGGAGANTLTGDQVIAVAGIVDARGGSSAVPASGKLSIQLTELLGSLSVGADDDVLLGGGDADTLVGDSQTVVSALRGAFATPLGASAQLTGTELVAQVDVKAGRDTIRGGAGNDVVVGDNDTTVAVQSGGTSSGLLSALGRLIDRLGIASATDDARGDTGINTVEQGNRAATPTGLVRSATVSSKGTGTPTAPVIDWSGRLDADLAASSSSEWFDSFANGLGREQDPNAHIRIDL
jgi:Ca2+-binding RTX toxin-like protein